MAPKNEPKGPPQPSSFGKVREEGETPQHSPIPLVLTIVLPSGAGDWNPGPHTQRGHPLRYLQAPAPKFYMHFREVREGMQTDSSSSRMLQKSIPHSVSHPLTVSVLQPVFHPVAGHGPLEMGVLELLAAGVVEGGQAGSSEAGWI